MPTRLPALACSFALLLACSASPPAEPEAPAAAPAPATQDVYTAAVQRGQVTSAITTTGSIAARRSTTIGPAVPGRLTHVFVQSGDEVAFGAPLFQIDPGPYATGLAEAEAGLAVGRAEFDEARRSAARVAQLAAKQIASDEDDRRARTLVSLAASRLQAAEARVTRARDDLNRTLVLAPYAGSIIERGAHEGTMATVTPNTAVVVLQESGALEAIVDVPESARVAVRPGDPMRLWTENLAAPIDTTVRAVSRAIDPRTRTYRVRAPVQDPSGALKSGAFVRAEIVPSPRADALLVERAALAQRDGTSFVFRVTEGRAERVEVRLGALGARDAEVLEGLAEGDVVVFGDAVGRLSDGARVRALEVAARAPAEARP